MPIVANSVNPATGAVASAAQPTDAFNTAAKGAEHAMKADMAAARGSGLSERVHDKLADHNMNKANRQFASDASAAQGAANAATGGGMGF